MPVNKPLRLVIDSNLWVSFIISNRLIKLDTLIEDVKPRILFSEQLIEELAATCSKPKLSIYFKLGAVAEMLAVFEPFIEIITVKTTVVACRDAKVNFLLALAKDGKADYLITGDKDLLSLTTFSGTIITTYKDFFASR